MPCSGPRSLSTHVPGVLSAPFGYATVCFLSASGIRTLKVSLHGTAPLICQRRFYALHMNPPRLHFWVPACRSQTVPSCFTTLTAHLPAFNALHRA